MTAHRKAVAKTEDQLPVGVRETTAATSIRVVVSAMQSG